MLLRLDGVKKQYGGFRLDCSIQVQEGYVTGIIGANGAGKSTIFKAILGLIKPDGGKIEFLGKDSRELTVLDRQQIGVVLSENTFSDQLTIMDVAAVMGATYKKFDRRRFLEKCELYRLPLKKQIKDFSTGMKAKLKLLLAMSYEARLLILDEPTFHKANSDTTSIMRNSLLLCQISLASFTKKPFIIISTLLFTFCYDQHYIIDTSLIGNNLRIIVQIKLFFFC